jgi:hypothetical protein
MADYDKSKLNKFLGKVTQDPKDLYATARKAGYTHAEIVDAHPSYADEKQRGVGRDSLNSKAQVEGRKAMGAQLAAQIRGGGGSGGRSDTRDLQLGADLDPKEMMKKEGYKKGGKVSSASTRADGIAQRGKTKGRIC